MFDLALPSVPAPLERAPLLAPQRPGALRGVLAGLARADARLSLRVLGADTPVLDRFVPALTQSANHGVLWLGCAGLMSLGGAHARRAGTRGMIALWIASALANGPAKAVARRRRPVGEVPLTRRLRRVPLSSSFPSGHAASAAAFCAGVALEHRGLGIAVAPLAAGVAYGRVHVGVHYPGDVLAGALLGAGAAVLVRKVWPVRPRAGAWARSTGVALTPRPGGLGCVVVVNGSAGSSELMGELATCAPEAEVWVCDGPEIVTRAREAAALASAQHGVLGVMGGDGSVRVAAAAALEHDVALWVIPGGTLNHFARELGVATVAEAVAAVESGEGVEVSLARANEEVFCNTFSTGVYPQLVAEREEREEQIGKWPALALALASHLRGAASEELVVGGSRRQVWTVFVGAGRYRPAGFAPSWRKRLDDDDLDVRVVDASRRFARARLVLAVLSGRLGRSSVHEAWSTPLTEISSPTGALTVALDGECTTLLSPVRLSVEPRRLRVHRGC